MKYFSAIAYMGFLLLTSCGGPIYNAYKPVKNMSWAKQDAYTFAVNVPEAGRYALFINLRYNENYAWSNLWIRADLKPPEEKVISQRFNIPLFSPAGYPLQDALGNIYFRRFPAQQIEQKLLPFDAEKPGIYTFTLHQEMRSATLQGIEKVGLQLKKMK